MSKLLEHINYFVKGFGFQNLQEFIHSSFKFLDPSNTPRKVALNISAIMASVLSFLENLIGVHFLVIVAFTVLIVAENQTGIKVDFKNGKKFKSRKFGRMFLKICVYLNILAILNVLNVYIDFPEIQGFEINPFLFLYWFCLIGIVFQLLISYLENLSNLGYNEVNGFLGALLRKYNEWFEFDGSKNNDKLDDE